MFSTFVIIKKEVDSEVKSDLLDKLINDFTRHIDSDLLDLQTEVDEDLFHIKKNARKIAFLKKRETETEQTARKVELFALIVKALAELQKKGRIKWAFYKENIYDLIEGFDNTSNTKLEQYLKKLRRI